MPSQSDKFEPTFIPLSDVIYEVARRVPVSDEDAEIRRGLSRSSDPLIAQLDLAPIKDSLGRARAARSLLAKLNKPPAERPHWVDASSGYPLLDDSASMDGLKILVAMERYESESLPRGGINRFKVSARITKEHKRLAHRSTQIGFMRNDLRRLLDASEDQEETTPSPVDSGVVEQEGTTLLGIEEYAREMSRLITLEATKTSIALEIVNALQNAADPRKPSSVWAELVQLAKDKKLTTLVYVNDTLIKVPEGKHGFGHYTKKRLTGFLGRYRKILEKQAGTRDAGHEPVG